MPQILGITHDDGTDCGRHISLRSSVMHFSIPSPKETETKCVIWELCCVFDIDGSKD